MARGAVHVAASVVAVAWLTAQDTDMVMLWIMVFGPGAVITAARLVVAARQGGSSTTTANA